MRAKLKDIYCSDIHDLSLYQPDDPEKFCLYIEASVGSSEGKGEDIFGITICTPKWILEIFEEDEIIFLRHVLVVSNYNYKKIHKK